MLTDRSRIIDFQRCPRRRYWRYHFAGQGLEPQVQSKALITGKLIHDGLDRLILGNNPGDVIIDITQMAEDSFAPDLPGRQDQIWVIEALLWAFYLKGLPQLLETYEILDTEREEKLELTEGLTLMARSDAILKERDTGDFYTASWKTTASYDQRKELSERHSMQTISEPLAAESRLGQPIVGTQMLYLVKGWEKKIEDGSTQLQSELVYGWMKDEEWASSYNWTCIEPHNKCPGGSNHRLGKGWEKFPVATCYPGGIRSWLSELSLGHIQPNAQESSTFLDKYIIAPPPITRSDMERDRWARQVILQEGRIEEGLERIKAYEAVEKDLEFILDDFFPMYEHSCEYPGRCPFWDLCHLPSEVDPRLRGFITRKSNHPREDLGE